MAKGEKKNAAAEGGVPEEETFVRGGGSNLAPIEKRKLEQVRPALGWHGGQVESCRMHVHSGMRSTRQALAVHQAPYGCGWRCTPAMHGVRQPACRSSGAAAACAACRCLLAARSSLILCVVLCCSLTPCFTQEAYAEAAADLAAEGKRGKRPRRGAQPATAVEGGDEEDAFFSSLSAQGRLPKYVELLKFKVGGRVGGCEDG